MAIGDIKIFRDNGTGYDEVLAQTYLLPLAGGTLSGNVVLGENVSIAYNPAGSVDGKYSGFTIAGIAGATLAFGDLIHLSPADSRWEKVRADKALDAVGDPRGLLGMCVLAAASDGDATVILLQGVIRADSKFPTLTVSRQCFVSGVTGGEITLTAPTTTGYIQRVVGFALTTDEILFSPSQNYVTVA